MNHDHDATPSVLVTGGSGYLGTRLIARLTAQGHHVRALVRAASVRKMPDGCEVIIGDVLNVDHIASALDAGDTLVHLVGTPHPSPAKAPLFRSVDLASTRASADAAAATGTAHVVYVSVAHPAPVMHAYIQARREAEAHLRALSLVCTIVRPWYVLGPGHYWPHLLRPLYALAEQVPSWRDGAQRLGLVTVSDMVATLAWSVEHPSDVETRVGRDIVVAAHRNMNGAASEDRVRVLEVPDIRRIGRQARQDRPLEIPRTS